MDDNVHLPALGAPAVLMQYVDKSSPTNGASLLLLYAALM